MNDKERKQLIELGKELNEKTGEGVYMCCKSLRENDFDIDKAEKWIKETRWIRRLRRE